LRILAGFAALVLTTGGLAALEPLPRPDFSRMDPDVGVQLGAAWDLIDELQEAEPESRARAYATLGELCLLYRLTETGVASFRNALELRPGVFEWTYYTGYGEQEVGRLDAAAVALRAAVSLDPDYLPGRYRLGQVELARHEALAAADEFRAVLSADEGFDAARYGLAQVHLLDRDYAAAAQLLEQVIASQPQAAAAHYQLGLAYRGLGRLDDARASLAKQGRSKVTFPDPLADRLQTLGTGQGIPLTRAVVARNRRDYDTSITSFRTVLESDPQDIVSRSGLAATLIEAGFEDAALTEFREILRLDPDHVYSNFASGKILADRGDFAGALPRLERAVAVESDVAQTQGFLGFVQSRLGRLPEAEASFSRALALEPLEEQVLMQRATVRMRQGRIAPALEDLEALLEIDSTNIQALQASAQLLGQIGRFSDTADAFGRLLELTPDDSNARFARGLALLLSRRYSEAVEHLDASARRTPGDTAVRHLLARSLATLPDESLRDGPRALEIAQEILAAEPSTDHAETLAMAFAETAQFEQAVALQQQVVDRARESGIAEISGLEQRLTLYKSGQPCREPWLGSP